MDAKVIEEMARAISEALMCGYTPTCKYCDQRDPIDRSCGCRLVAHAVYPIARAAALREAAGIARDAYRRAHRSGDENELEPDYIAAAILKEAELGDRNGSVA
jgi:hypothetical protein